MSKDRLPRNAGRDHSSKGFHRGQTKRLFYCIKFIVLRCILLLFLLMVTCSLAGQERFTRWQTDIEPRRDRSVVITETLKVNSEGDVIKRGITRSLPQSRGNRVKLLSVERDGRETPYHTRNEGGYLTIYTGERDRFLDPGPYVYRIRYTIGKGVHRVGELDELQIDVVDPTVSLPVEEVAATVTVPAGVEVVQYACYTGRDGTAQRNCTMTAPDSGRLSFVGAGRFGLGEGLSVAVGVETGYFAAPAPAAPKQLANPPGPVSWWQAEGSVLLMLLGGLGGLFYAYRTWKTYGVDPEPPRARREYAAPDALPPAAIGYLASDFGYDNAAGFTSTIVFLATRGYLEIEEEEDAGIFSTDYTYCIRASVPAPPAEGLSVEQRTVYDMLFREGTEVQLDKKYDKRIRKIAERHGKVVQSTYEDRNDVEKNGWKVLPLFLIFIGTLVPAVLLGKTDTTGYALPALVVYGLVGAIGIAVFSWLVRRPSPELVGLRTRIRSLREYLSLPESERKQQLNAPPMDRAHYEELLPYAIALGINTKWSDYFGDLLQEEHYQPVWMAGGHNFHAARFTDSFGEAVSAGSTPPGSASASGGGGSVGGGVGGGGAGGW